MYHFQDLEMRLTLPLECLGPVVVSFLSNPEKVRRRNGTRVQVGEQLPDLEELKALLKSLYRKDVILM